MLGSFKNWSRRRLERNRGGKAADRIQRSQRQHATALDCQQRQIPGRVGSGIDIGTVGADVRCADGRMAMDDEFTEIFLAVEKLVPDPEQIVFLLFVERNSRPDTGMDEEKI